MTPADSAKPSIGTTAGRWAALGPYYAMFPLDFAFRTVCEYSQPGDTVLDPFAGRGSSIYAAAVRGRKGVGVEINPLGWLYGHVKLAPAPEREVLNRLEWLGEEAHSSEHNMDELPIFFRRCFSDTVLPFLLTARDELQWRTDRTDATLMALIVVYLHDKPGRGLSNQMRQTKAMAPEYSVRWWDERNLAPPDIDPVAFLASRIRWRYAKGWMEYSDSQVILGDSTQVLMQLEERVSPFRLLFTSPPYFSVTNYFYDQWLRLWMLGGDTHPNRDGQPWTGKFESKARYEELLRTVFEASERLMARNAVIYVRTDARIFTYETTLDVLRETFTSKSVNVVPRPVGGRTQTALYGDKRNKPGEVDIILQ